MALLTDIEANLKIDVDTYHKNAPKFNNFVKPGEKIKNIEWYKNKDGSMFGVITSKPNEYKIDPVTTKELNKIYHLCPTITLKSNKAKKSFTNKKGFTLKELMNHILTVERLSRPKTDWFGGIDAHHIYFEGLYPVTDHQCTYEVHWGS